MKFICSFFFLLILACAVFTIHAIIESQKVQSPLSCTPRGVATIPKYTGWGPDNLFPIQLCVFVETSYSKCDAQQKHSFELVVEANFEIRTFMIEFGGDEIQAGALCRVVEACEIAEKYKGKIITGAAVYGNILFTGNPTVGFGQFYYFQLRFSSTKVSEASWLSFFNLYQLESVVCKLRNCQLSNLPFTALVSTSHFTIQGKELAPICEPSTDGQLSDNMFSVTSIICDRTCPKDYRVRVNGGQVVDATKEGWILSSDERRYVFEILTLAAMLAVLMLAFMYYESRSFINMDVGRSIITTPASQCDC